MAVIIKNLWAKAGTLSLPGQNVPFWGYAPAANRPPQLPGPVIVATVGDTLRIRLRNNLSEPTSIIFPGLENVMVRRLPSGTTRPARPQYEDGLIISLTNFLEPGTNVVMEYSFRATRPGVFLYESGTHPEKQIQMGLYGIIIVRPVGHSSSGHPNYHTAYGSGTGSRYDVEKVLALGEIDSQMHKAVVPEEYYNMLTFKPDYWLMNGRSYPDTLRSDDNSSQPYSSAVSCQAGQRLLLRLVNAGYQTHTIHWGGLTGRIIAGDSFPYKTPVQDNTYQKTGITLSSGQTYDVLITPEARGDYFIYDREYLHLLNNDQFPGGMMTGLRIQ
ncbi:MAG: multicopper oxidase domain-containing protein [Bacillota bacterium]